MKNSLYIKIIFIIIILITTSLFIFGSYDVISVYLRMKNNQKALFNYHSKNLANQLWILVYDYNREQIDKVTTTEMQNKNIYAIIIRDSIDNSIISAKTRNIDWNIIEYKKESVSLENYLLIKENIKRFDETIGTVEIYFTDKFLRKDILFEILKKIITILLLLMIIILTLAVLIYNNILKPIEKLSNSVKSVTEGKLDRTIDISRNDEIGTLAKTFNYMRDSIRDKIKNLAESEKKYRELVETMNDGFAIIDLDNKLTYVNSNFSKMLGYSKTELKMKDVKKLINEKNKKILRNELEKRKKGKKKPYEFEFTHKNGKQIAVYISPQPLYDNNGKYKGSFAVITDITELKNIESELKASLKEKDILFKEINHRVKNNLNVIYSLLFLQLEKQKEPYIIDILKNIQNKIISISFIHQLLYKSDNVSYINFSDYIKMLTEHLLNSNAEISNKIQIKLNIKDIFLDIQTAMPCGLIINELVTNSFKHAFKDMNNGIINIKFTKNKKEYSLTVSDNGIGLPDNFDLNSTKTMGIFLVNSLTQQLEGKIDINNKNGTEFIINFKEINYK